VDKLIAPGYENLNHYQSLGKLFKERFGDRESVSGIEIGTKCADATRTILWTLTNCQLYTIDPYEHRDKAEFEAGEPQPYHDQNRAYAEGRLLLPEFGDRVVMLIMKSTEAHKWITDKNPGKLFDFVWIDGDHSEEGITADLDLYESLVAPGGVFGGHDYGQVHPLTEIIDARYGDKINAGGDFTWWIYK
jgi:hypothetical protein